MVRIAICDDMSHELRNLVALTEQYVSRNGVDAEVIGFNHPDALLTAMEAERFHVYVLDIVMPMVSGLELGKAIRRIDREAQIIYASTEPQFALQAYAAHPLSYLVKPIGAPQLFDALALALARVATAEEPCFAVKTLDSLRVVNMAHIICCEYSDHAAIFSMASGETVRSRTFPGKFLGILCPPLAGTALPCSATPRLWSTCAGLNALPKGDFTLHGGKTIPIAPKRYAVVRDTYMNYLMARTGDQVNAR
ncbi:MAG: response regulator [Paenacidovorax caeni]